MSLNGAQALTDLLLHPAVEGEAAEPPTAPAEGECWLVGAGASGAFEGREQSIAGFQSGTWLFAPPCEGMTVYDRTSGQRLLFAGTWRREVAPAAPAGGVTIDQEARGTIVALLACLRRVGILPAE